MVCCTRYDTTNNEDLHRLKILEKQKHLTDEDRTSVFFSIAKIYQDCELHDKAFYYFAQGNTLQAKKYPFSTAKFIDHISSTIEFQTKELLAEKALFGNTSKTPVIIVGTPRSGTTLVEQILSSHHDVFGAGELTWVGAAASAIKGYLETDTPYPACTKELTKSNIIELAGKYLHYLQSLASGESRITDKMPNNFLNLGLIHILFPNARIIHCRRDFRDACTSMFCQYFPGGHAISHDMFKLGIYYKQYQRLMSHWRAVLPADTMIEVDYETLVANQEAESRRIVDFIDMEWDDACLDFYKKKRLIYTASSKQVTKPIYTSSVGRWKRYKEHLQLLEDGFNHSAKN
ncbi:MAG TPA: sulfotransferase [Crenotrichaceae bacterium]|nr:sulfotransferase [Crenotrichaceae bacterium]